MKLFPSNRAALDAKGFAHYILPLVVMVLIGAVGTFLIVSSNANSLTAKKTKTGRIVVTGVFNKCKMNHSSGAMQCRYVKSSDNLMISASDKNGDEAAYYNNLKCKVGNRTIKLPNDRSAVNLGKIGKTRSTLNCTPGYYTVRLQDPKSYPDKGADSAKTVQVISGQTAFAHLGSLSK